MKIEVRNGKVVLDGYVNAVERFSKPLIDSSGKFIERVMPGVFKRALERTDDVPILLDHEDDKKLASTKDGTAKLYEDNIGLRAIVETEDATVIEKAKKGLLRGWSFRMICNKQDRIPKDNGITERTIRDLDLLEVSVIDDKKIPAYNGTSIEMRDNESKLIECRFEEFETDTKEPKKTDFSTMTASQKRELLSVELRKNIRDSYLEDYDNNCIYANIESERTTYKIPYSIVNGEVSFDMTKKVKVVRGGYQEVREVPMQQANNSVEKINNNTYYERLKKLREEN